MAQDSAAPTPPSEGDPAGRLIDYPRRGGPTVLRILLGAQLRRLREARGISTEQAGYEIRGSHSKISRMELGRVGFKERDVSDLLTLYGVSDPDERAPLLELAKEANTPGWWHRYGDVLPSWFEVYLGLEEAASLLRTYELQFVPGLLQTEDYARAVVRPVSRTRPTRRSSAASRCAPPGSTGSPHPALRPCGPCWTRRSCAVPSAGAP